jgi:predicted RNA-binding Zn-ribbon protein involved in translation (DUF1610 family)
MDIAPIVSAVAVVQSVIASVKNLVELMPDSPARNEKLTALEEASRKLKSLEITNVVREMGAQICFSPEHELPVAMRSKDRVHWICPECGQSTDVDFGGFIKSR